MFYNNLDQPKLISWALEFWDKIVFICRFRLEIDVVQNLLDVEFQKATLLRNKSVIGLHLFFTWLGPKCLINVQRKEDKVSVWYYWP